MEPPAFSYCPSTSIGSTSEESIDHIKFIMVTDLPLHVYIPSNNTQLSSLPCAALPQGYHQHRLDVTSFSVSFLSILTLNPHLHSALQVASHPRVIFIGVLPSRPCGACVEFDFPVILPPCLLISLFSSPSILPIFYKIVYSIYYLNY